MTSRMLFVMRMKPANAEAVAELFGEHDSGDMARSHGVTRRTLFRFHDLYMHLVEGGDDAFRQLGPERSRPDFKELNGRLNEYLERYDPENWRDLKDSMASPFYTWTDE